ncbi:MAG TPA: ATP-binding protein, partial [Acidimicrobiales bacterium]
MSDRPPRRRLSLRLRLLLLLTGAAVVLLLVVGVQLAAQARLADRRDHLLDRIDPAIAATSDLRAAVLDQETGLRGYVLTADEVFLEPYRRGEAAADDALGALDRLVGDDPAMAERIAAVRTALGDWREGTAVPALDGSLDRARSAAFLDAGREQFDAVRAGIDELGARLDVARHDDMDDLDAAYTTVLGVVVLEVGGMVVVGIVIAIALSRLVLQPLSRLGREARLVAAGDLTRPVPGEGPPELQRLGRDVEAMRARIVDELDQLEAIRADLERRTEELERSNADLEQFAYVASHDLQEPLRKVSGFCQLLEKRYADQLDDRAREYIWFAVDGAKRMQVLINDLLAFSRVGRTTEGFEPVDLDEVADDVVDLLAESIEVGDATVTVGPLPTVEGDRRLLAAVLQNLVGNALKFRQDEPPVVDVCAERSDGEWTITVADNGIGIDPTYGEQIFTIFKRLHNKADYAGTGIGLALCKKIVEFHGGRIWLEPTDGPGATFAFTLPAPPDPP